MTLSSRDKNLILGGIALIILVLGIKFGYMDFSDKAKTQKEKLDKVEAEYENLYNLYQHRESYQKSIEENKQIIENILKFYPANSTQEYQIMYLNSFEVSSTWIYSYNIAQPTTATKKAIAGQQYTAIIEPAEIQVSATYGDMLEFIKKVNENQNRTKLNNVTLAYNTSDRTVSGTIKLETYSVVGGDRVPETVNTVGVLIGREDASLFESNTFTPNMGDGDQSSVTKIRNDSDIFVLVNPAGSTLDNVIVGLSKDSSGKSNLVASGSKKHEITITINGSNGSYEATYKLNDQIIQNQTFVAGDSTDILISSSARPADVDNVEAKIKIVNNSDRTVNYTVINDDKVAPRVSVDTSGNVTPY